MVMFSRISLALLVVVKKVSTVNAFLSRGMSLGHLNALKTITRPFLSTYDGFNSNDKVRKTADTLEDQINQLQSEISATKGRRDELLSSNRDPAAIALTGEIVEKEKRLRVLTEQGLAATQVGKKKTVYFSVQSAVKNAEPIVYDVDVENQAEMDVVLDSHRYGFLIIDDTVPPLPKTYDELIDGSTYCLPNGQAVPSARTRAQVQYRVLEHQVSLAMVNFIGRGAHVHRNVKFTDEETKKDLVELDIIVVHEGGEDVPDSVVYVIECELSPQVKDVDLLLDKVEVFRLHAPSSLQFRSVGKIVPILAGKMWSDEVIQEFEGKNEARVLQGMEPILRIQPSGKDFKVIR